MGKLLSVIEAAERIGVSESLVYQWVEERRIPHYRLGGKGKRGKVMIEEADLSAFLASCRHEAKPDVPPLKHIRLNHG
jgi:excisionase family DNA binding protein